MASRVAIVGRKCADPRMHYLEPVLAGISDMEGAYKVLAVSQPDCEALMKCVVYWQISPRHLCLPCAPRGVQQFAHSHILELCQVASMTRPDSAFRLAA